MLHQRRNKKLHSRGRENKSGHLWLDAGDGAAHDEAMPPHAAVPLGPYPLDLHVGESRLCEPLQARHQHIRHFSLLPKILANRTWQA